MSIIWYFKLSLRSYFRLKFPIQIGAVEEEEGAGKGRGRPSRADKEAYAATAAYDKHERNPSISISDKPKPNTTLDSLEDTDSKENHNLAVVNLGTVWFGRFLV
ncbi:hypothetical protein Hanom_Chr03g00274771 [Helianthus anomalus]